MGSTDELHTTIVNAVRWTQEQLNAYESRRLSSRAKPEPVVRHEPLGTLQGEGGYSRRLVVRIKSFRVKLLDTDNLVGGAKYFLDGLRYAGLIPDDSPDKITLEVTQEKVTKNEERTEIEIL